LGHTDKQLFFNIDMVEQSFSKPHPLPNPHIVVIGGGITGLSCAFQLQQRLQASDVSCRITLLEASERVGGKILTDHIDGFIIDAGADVFMARKPGAVALCTALNLTDRIQETDPSNRKTYVRHVDGTLHPITMYENEPLATLRGGMQELADTTARNLAPGTIRLRTRAINIEYHNNAYHIDLSGEQHFAASDSQHLTADAVVIAVPARQTATILNAFIPDSERLLSGVSYTKTTTVSAAYRRAQVPNPLHGYGYIIKDAQAGSVSACTWSSSKIPGRAPNDHVLLRAFVRGVDLPPSDVHALVTEEFRRVLDVTASPLFIRSYQWPEAIPIYSTEHGQHIVELDQQLTPFAGLTIAGSAIGATGIPDSIRSGMEAADVVWNYVTTGTWVERHLQRDAMMVAQAQSFFAR
jgi:protoporphyrinogen oxidase